MYAFELLRGVFSHGAVKNTRHYYRDEKGVPRIDFQFEGPPPELRHSFDPEQRQVLNILANCQDVWAPKSNLWSHFGLPDSREETLRLVALS